MPKYEFYVLNIEYRWERGFSEQVLSYTSLSELLICASRSVLSHFLPSQITTLFCISRSTQPLNMKLDSSLKHLITNVGKYFQNFMTLYIYFLKQILLNFKFPKKKSELFFPFWLQYLSDLQCFKSIC
jgi:hypothetical protein